MRMPTPPSFTIRKLAEPFGNGLFSSPHDFRYFLSFMTTLCVGFGPRTITLTARMAEEHRHYTRFRDFLVHGSWNEREVGPLRFAQLMEQAPWTTLSDGRKVLVDVIDDTLNPKPYGPCLFGTAVHHDHAAAPHQKEYIRAHNHVLYGVIPNALQPSGARTHLISSELYIPFELTEEGNPSTDPAHTQPFETRTQLASLLLDGVRDRVPKDMERITLVDALYTKNGFLKSVAQHAGHYVLGRIQNNRVLFEVPADDEQKRVGRRRKYGPRWNWADVFETESSVEEVMLGTTPTRLRLMSRVVKIKGFDHPVRIVISQLVDVATSRPTLFICTDTRIDAVTVLRLYSARFSIEESIRDVRVMVGFGTEMLRRKEGALRMTSLFLLAQSWLRELADSQPVEVRERVRDPWRKPEPRLTVGLIQQALRYECWAGKTILATFWMDQKLAKTPSPPAAAIPEVP